MSHWQRLPDTLDPDVRRLVEQLRMLKDRSGCSLQALAEATACSKSAWQRYLNGTKFPPRGVVASLGRLAGADAHRLLALWDIAEPAWQPEVLSSGTAPAPAPALAPVGALATVGTRSGPPVVPPVELPVPVEVVPGERPPTPRRRLVRSFALAGTLALLAAAGTVWGPALRSVLATVTATGHRPAQDAVPAAAGACSGASCQGRDPYASGCDRGAVTAGSVDVDSLIVQLRYSSRCGAAWTHAQGGELSMGLRSLSISGTDGSVLASIPAPGAAAPTDHSPILATPDPNRVEACAVVDDVQACAGTHDPGGPPRVLTYLPADSN